MLKIFKTTENNLAVIPDVVEGAWVQVVNPTPEEVEKTYSLGIPQDFVTYPLDLDERPRTEREAGATLLLLRTPYYQGETEDIPYTTIPLGIILCNDFIITISKYRIPLLDLNGKKSRNFSTNKRNQFILHILLAVANEYLAAAREINKKVDLIEDELQKSIRNKEVLELLKYQKSLELLSTALRSNELVFEKLQRMRFFKAFPDDSDLLEDVITENQQAIEMTGIASNLLSQMMDAFASIISNNQNQVIKLLTSVTIVLSLPTLVSSFFGMNVALPMTGNPLAFIWIVLVCLVVMGTAIFVFSKRDWL